MLAIDSPYGRAIHSDSASLPSKMPVDFASYLLSASPPGFDFFLLRDQFGPNRTNMGAPFSIQPVLQNRTRIQDVNKEFNDSFSSLSLGDAPEVIVSDSLKKSSSDCSLSSLDAEVDNHSNSWKTRSQSSLDLASAEKFHSRGKLRKRVSFADELGGPLCYFKIMTESSDTPPRLRPELLSRLTVGATAGVTEQPPLALNFKQPASDYLEFRERLNRDCVCLENVILKDYNLLGTVKVKNISFEKSVKIRCTFNSWETNTDVACMYCANGQGGQYDTFSFELSVPPDFDIKKKVEFCVCFTANNQEFWDSNGGLNYGIVPADWKDTIPKGDGTTNAIFSLHNTPDWGGFSSWSHNDGEVPYY